MSVQDLTRLYDDLGRFQWWRRRLAGDAGTEGLGMHKQLSDGGVGLSDLNAWLWERLGDPEPRRVLDLGAGFGATLFEWAERLPDARFTGLSLSPYQVARARAVAAKRGLDQRVEFVETDNARFDPGASKFDLAVSIETLFHSTDLQATIRRVAGWLNPGGRFVLVEDMLREPPTADDAPARDLSRLWATPTLHTVDEFRAALAAANLELIEEHDLSGHVTHGEPDALSRKKSKLGRWARRCPVRSVREVLRAFQGGIALEELYAHGSMTYRAWIARRTEEPSR